MNELRRLFELVCDLPPAEQPDALRAAGANDAMIHQVTALLRADAAAVTRISKPIAAARALADASELAPGELLGAWRLSCEIGHGGMGIVYLAERADGAFEQQAAIKLIRGVADVSTIAHFTRERQLLAQLRHPQIARLLDGGSTPAGHPYIVMEYVEGRSLQAWRSDSAPGLKDRLRLVASVARTVQYAHRQLIVHCDLKPSNILVSADNLPILLDFGVSHALDHGETGDAARGKLAGGGTRYVTARYASPEQLKGESPGVAADIFALGLLLSELVTEQLPERSTDGLAAIAATASGAMSSNAVSAASSATAVKRPSVAAHQTLPWRQQLRGDIDAIVARACAHDPAARYASADAFADDIERIARHEPLSARPATLGYVASRLLRRRWPVFAVAATLIALSAVFTWRTILAERDAQREAATARSASDFLVSVFAASDSNANSNARHELTAREVLDKGAERIRSELASEPAVRARLLRSLGDAYRHMGLDDKAAPLLREAVDLNLTPAVNQPLVAATTLTALANTYANGEFPAADAERAARESISLWQAHTRGESVGLANAWMVLSLGLNEGGKADEALAAAKETLAMLERVRAPDDRINAALNNLGMISSRRGDHEAAKRYYQRCLDGQRRSGRADTGGFALQLNNYALALERNNELAASITAQQEAIRLATRFYGEDGGLTTAYRNSLARKLTAQGNYDQALAILQNTFVLSQRIHGEHSAEAFNVQQLIANVYFDRGEFERALPHFRETYDQRRTSFGADDPRVLRVATQLALTLTQMGNAQRAEAVTLLPAALAAAERRGDNGVDVQAALVAHASALLANGERATSEALLTRVRTDATATLWTRVRVTLLRAELARTSGDAATALTQTTRTWQQLHDSLGPAHPHTARLHITLAQLRRAAGEAAASTGSGDIDQAIRIVEHAFPPRSAYRNIASTTSKS